MGETYVFNMLVRLLRDKRLEAGEIHYLADRLTAVVKDLSTRQVCNLELTPVNAPETDGQAEAL